MKVVKTHDGWAIESAAGLSSRRYGSKDLADRIAQIVAGDLGVEVVAA